MEGPPRQRVLSPAETDALLRAIDAEEDVHARAGLLLLMTTGARLTEALRAKWEDLSDLEGDRPMWTIPSPKAGTPQAVPLPAKAVKVLLRLPRLGPFIVVGRQRLRPRKDLKGPWARALERAKLSDAGLAIHDLRRSHGLEVYRTSGLLAAQKLLRHSDPRITAKVYVPLAAEDLRGAQEKRAKLLKFKTGESAG
jgi:integrase